MGEARVLMKKVWLDEMTWKESEQTFKKTDMAVICCGATHPHGLACPLGTDTFVADGMGEKIGKKANVVVVPTIPYGYNQYHMDFPGCVNISKDHLRDFYLDICESLYKWGIRKLVFLSPHGGNVSVIDDVAYRLRYEKGILSALVSYELAAEVDPDLRGYNSEGLVDETSMMIYLRPDTAHPERAMFKGYKNFLGPRLKVVGWNKIKLGKGAISVFATTKDVSDECEFVESSGDFAKAADMSNASRELGQRIIETAVDYIVEFIEEFKRVEIPSV